MPLFSKFTQIAFWAAAVAFVLAASAASAQTYPSDVGSVSAGAGDTDPAPGTSVQVTGTAFDSAGNPLEEVEITFAITSNPGDASFDNGEQSIIGITDENGVATVILNTGADPGTIVVSVEASGVLSQVTLNSGVPQSLPTTGGATGSDGSSQWVLVLAAIGGALVLATAALALSLRQRPLGR